MAFSNVTSRTPRVLILGHSFVRRHKQFITIQARQNTDFALDFKVSDVCTVCMLGIGGRTVDKMVRLDLPTIRDMAPDIVILELGSNDFCDTTSDAETTGLAIEAFVELLYHQCSVRYIMVCEVIPRSNQPFPYYNDKVDSLNRHLVKALANAPFAGVWRHRGLYHPTINIYLPDGIHLNDSGNKALYRSYRGAILAALRGQ